MASENARRMEELRRWRASGIGPDDCRRSERRVVAAQAMERTAMAALVPGWARRGPSTRQERGRSEACMADERCGVSGRFPEGEEPNSGCPRFRPSQVSSQVSRILGVPNSVRQFWVSQISSPKGGGEFWVSQISALSEDRPIRCLCLRTVRCSGRCRRKRHVLRSAGRGVGSCRYLVRWGRAVAACAARTRDGMSGFGG